MKRGKSYKHSCATDLFMRVLNVLDVSEKYIKVKGMLCHISMPQWCIEVKYYTIQKEDLKYWSEIYEN